MTPLVRLAAVKKGWMARPAKDRWHKKPTALFGGIAIFAGFAVPMLMTSDFSGIHLVKGDLPRMDGHSFGLVTFMGATFLFLLGILDDIISIKPQTKLIGQILVASLVTFLGFRLHWFNSLTIDTVVTMFWIVGITNAFNLLDNMDGLCAGIG